MSPTPTIASALSNLALDSLDVFLIVLPVLLNLVIFRELPAASMSGAKAAALVLVMLGLVSVVLRDLVSMKLVLSTIALQCILIAAIIAADRETSRLRPWVRHILVAQCVYYYSVATFYVVVLVFM